MHAFDWRKRLEDGTRWVIEGEARRVTDHARLVELAEVWESKYDGDWHFDVANGAPAPPTRLGDWLRLSGGQSPPSCVQAWETTSVVNVNIVLDGHVAFRFSASIGTTEHDARS